MHRYGFLNRPRERTHWQRPPIPLSFPHFRAARGGPRKVRIIDDARSSRADAIATFRAASIQDITDSLLPTAAYYRMMSRGRDILSAPTDIPHRIKISAYLPGRILSQLFFLGPMSGPLQVSHLRTHPFGSARDPWNWARANRMIQRPPMTYFGIYLPISPGDSFIAELADTVPSAYLSVAASIRMCGFELDNAPKDATIVRPFNSADFVSTWLHFRVVARSQSRRLTKIARIHFENRIFIAGSLFAIARPPGNRPNAHAWQVWKDTVTSISNPPIHSGGAWK